MDSEADPGIGHHPDPTTNRVHSGSVSAAARRREIAGIVAGSIIAAAIAFAFSPSSLPTGQKLSGVFAWTLFAVLLTLASGTLVLFSACAFAKSPSRGAMRLAWHAAAAWVFFPCVAVLVRFHSLVALPVAVISAVVMALRLRRVLPPLRQMSPPARRNLPVMQSLSGLPPSDSQPLKSMAAAVLAYGGLLCAGMEREFYGSLLLALAAALPLWRWTSVESPAVRASLRNATTGRAASLALLLTVLALLSQGFAGLRWSLPGGGAGRSVQPVFAAEPGINYIGIVLWPPPKKKQLIVPPSSTAGGSGVSRPLTIPFDGPYWYFQPPRLSPGPAAHVAHGKPTEVKIRATNWLPLVMEAHQNLALPIAAGCCRALQVTLLNADPGRGDISIGVALTDSQPGTRHMEFLGRKTLPPVPNASGSSPAGSSRQILEFSIPRVADFNRFDAITVTFQPGPEHRQTGTKVAIESFTLLPR